MGITSQFPCKTCWSSKCAGDGSTSMDGKLPTPSRVSLAVALISLMFILALLWRSISQRRALNQEEAQLRASLEGGL